MNLYKTLSKIQQVYDVHNMVNIYDHFLQVTCLFRHGILIASTYLYIWFVSIRLDIQYRFVVAYQSWIITKYKLLARIHMCTSGGNLIAGILSLYMAIAITFCHFLPEV